MIADIGTTWTKIFDGNSYRVLATREVIKKRQVFEKATGHLGERYSHFYMNELEALARGAKKMVKIDDFVVVDVGSRDIKYVRFNNGCLSKLDWNQSCGATTGFTLELLMNYYSVLPTDVVINEEEPFAPLTCAVFGIEKVFDLIINGVSPKLAIGEFIKSMALNIYEFVGKPEKVFLSGGMCENVAFIKALSLLTDVVPLGRFVLLEGVR